MEFFIDDVMRSLVAGRLVEVPDATAAGAAG
jgi:hypothetical protein